MKQCCQTNDKPSKARVLYNKLIKLILVLLLLAIIIFYIIC